MVIRYFVNIYDYFIFKLYVSKEEIFTCKQSTLNAKTY